MKKISILIAFLFCAIISCGQTTPYPNNGTGISNDSTLYWIKGGTRFSDGSVITNYTDTASANLKHISHYSGSHIFVNDTVWVRNITATKWIPEGTGSLRNDTLFAQLPAFFDSATRSPNTVLKILQGDGFTPGIVTWDSLLVFSVSPSSITLSNKTWNFPATTLTLSPADPTYSRYDLFGIDSSGPFVLKGTPSPSPTIPQVGVDSFALTSGFLINPGDTVPSGVSITTIYNENLGYPQEWLAQFSNGTADYNNTDNPYNLVKDGFISKYNNGQIRFLDYNGTYIRNTPEAGAVLKIPIYINGAFNNSIYAKFYDSSSTSTNNLLITQPSFGFNPNDSNVYQVLTIPLSSFTWKNTGKFTTLALIMTGVDTSGAKGFYIDYVTLQNGVPNIPAKTYADSAGVYKVNDTTYVPKSWENGIATVVGDTIKVGSGGGSGNTNSNVGTGYRLAIPGTNDIKTLLCSGCALDSVTANVITLTVTPTDTTSLSNRINLKKDNTDSINLITGYTTLYQNSLKQNLITKIDSVALATAGQTAFTFVSVPSNTANYKIYVNGIKWTYGTGYTTSGNVVTLTTALFLNDAVEYIKEL